MATYICCPHCDKALRVPEGCGGRPTRCPNCQQPLVIPGTRQSSDLAFVCAVIAPEAGTVTQADVDQARGEADRLSVMHLDSATQLSLVTRNRQREHALLSLARLCMTARHELDHSLGRTGGFFIAMTLSVALVLLLASFFHPSGFGHFIAGALGLVLAVAVYVPLAFVPEDAAFAPFVAEAERKIEHINALLGQISAEEQRLAAEHNAAEKEYRRLRAAIDSRLHYLRTCPWHELTGKEFEQFLVQLFQERGYRVEQAGDNPDAGVDLILDRDGRRVAVQATASIGHAVGNEAVQKLYDSLGDQRCDSAAVVTNSRFTFAARALAERTGCQLIDAGQIPDLIEGRVMV